MKGNWRVSSSLTPRLDFQFLKTLPRSGEQIERQEWMHQLASNMLVLDLKYTSYVNTQIHAEILEVKIRDS